MEVILEVFFELIFEIFAELIASIISHFITIYNTDKRARKVIKCVFSFVIFALVLALLLFSLFTKKGLYVTAVLVYLILMVLVHIFKFIDQNDKYEGLIKIISGVLRYLISICLIVIASQNLNITSNGVILTCSIVAIIIFLGIDIFRIVRFIKAKRQ